MMFKNQKLTCPRLEAYVEFSEKDLADIQLMLAKQLTTDSSLELSEACAFTFETREIERSKETLIRKRISQTRRQLPKCSRALGKEFSTWFRRFALRNHFNGVHAIRDEAIAFANWILENPLDVRLDKSSLDELNRVAKSRPSMRMSSNSSKDQI